MFDPARLPVPVLHRMALTGYWAYPRDLRDKVDDWDHLDDSARAVVEHDLDLMSSALARA